MTYARVFQSGNSQAVRLPKEFRLNAEQVEIFRQGDDIVLRQTPTNAAAVFDILATLPADFLAQGLTSLALPPMVMLIVILALIFVLVGIFAPTDVKGAMPVFTGTGFGMVEVPVGVIFFTLCGLCTSVMWGTIFNLAVEGLGKYTSMGSGIFMVMVCGGGILPLIQGGVADFAGYLSSYWVVVAGLAYMLFYALVGSKNVNKDIPVEE